MTDRDSATSPPGEGNDLTLQTNVGRLRASYSAWNREGDIGAIVDQLDPEIEFQAFRDESPEGRTFFHGHEGVRRWARDVSEAWSEIIFEPVELVEAADRVLVVVKTRTVGRASGVQSEGMLGHLWTMGPDGKAIRLELFGDLDSARRAFERAPSASPEHH